MYEHVVCVSCGWVGEMLLLLLLLLMPMLRAMGLFQRGLLGRGCGALAAGSVLTAHTHACRCRYSESELERSAGTREEGGPVGCGLRAEGSGTRTKASGA